MKTRQEIKSLAKEAVAQQRGTAILIVLLFTVVSWAISYFSGLLVWIPVFGWAISIAAYGFTLVLAVNLDGEYIKIFRRENADVGGIFTALSINFWRKLGGMAWMTLWVTLWTMLLIIPGIIKGIAYFLTPYLLADCPNVKARDALKLSMRITKGHKLDIFVMMLSFIGWLILSAFTFGILWIVYVGPYMYATYAGYFLELREKALRDGVITRSDLGWEELSIIEDDVAEEIVPMEEVQVEEAPVADGLAADVTTEEAPADEELVSEVQDEKVQDGQES